MPQCYLLSACSGSSLDQTSNNITLFNLVEQLNLPEGQPAPLGQLIPIELHAYWRFSPGELQTEYETRFVLVALETGLEATGDTNRHRALTAQLRTRVIGLPLPPVPGFYDLRVDWRLAGTDGWHRDPATWPIRVAERSGKPPVVH